VRPKWMISESIRRIGDQRPERESEGDDTHICGSERHTAYDAASSKERSGSDVKDRQVRPGPMAMIADLRQRHYISDPTSKLLRELRRLRNAVAHEEEEPHVGAALAYAESADTAIRLLDLTTETVSSPS